MARRRYGRALEEQAELRAREAEKRALEAARKAEETR